MRSKQTQMRAALLSLATLFMLIGAGAPHASAQVLPTPQLKFGGTEDYEANGKQWTKYKLPLFNRSAYAEELFAPAPDLPPCGQNKNSARTWVDIYARKGRSKIYGFCALKEPRELGYLWFAVEKGTPPPASVYVVITDRRNRVRVVSNVVDIPQPGKP